MVLTHLPLYIFGDALHNSILVRDVLDLSHSESKYDFYVLLETHLVSAFTLTFDLFALVVGCCHNFRQKHKGMFLFLRVWYHSNPNRIV